MEDRSRQSVTAPSQQTIEPRSRTFAQADFDRANAIAESFVRNVYTVQETIFVAEQLFVSGVVTCSRGDVMAAGNQLTRAMVGMALGAWQNERLSAAAVAQRDFAGASLLRADGERNLHHLPARMFQIATILRTSPEGEAAFLNLQTTVLAFVVGSGIAERLLGESAAAVWHRDFAVDSAGARDTSGGQRVTDLGVPDLTLRSRGADQSHPHSRSGCPALSTREREVLIQIVAGHTTSEIAYRLGVKTTTVATLVGRIFNKLGVNNRPSAVAAALRYGLCTHEDWTPARPT